MAAKAGREVFGIRMRVWVLALAILAGFLALRRVPQTNSPRDNFHVPRPRVEAVAQHRSRDRRAVESPAIDPQLVELRLTRAEPQQVPSLIDALSSPLDDVRLNAASALSGLGFAAADAVPRLTELALDDPNDQVRARAREALYNIRGYVPSFEPSVER
jgi:hypothetical protein